MTNLPIPVIKALRKLGQDINDARRRRRITIALMAERADLSRATIGKIEHGDPTTSMGGYASVLSVLGMEGRLSDLAAWVIPLRVAGDVFLCVAGSHQKQKNKIVRLELFLKLIIS